MEGIMDRNYNGNGIDAETNGKSNGLTSLLAEFSFGADCL